MKTKADVAASAWSNPTASALRAMLPSELSVGSLFVTRLHYEIDASSSPSSLRLSVLVVVVHIRTPRIFACSNADRLLFTACGQHVEVDLYQRSICGGWSTSVEGHVEVQR